MTERISKTAQELRMMVLAEIRPNYVCPDGIDVKVRADADRGWAADFIPPLAVT